MPPMQGARHMLLKSATVNLGQPAPDFTLPTPDGTLISRTEVMGSNGLLVAFICNHCPYVVAVIDRLVADIAQLAKDDIGAVCIMSNDWASYPADSPEKMTEFAARHGLTVPYLVDADQSVARGFDAVCTPDFFGLDRDGMLAYRGRLDDARLGDASNRTPELVNAMRQIAQTGQAPAEQTAAMGCSIKWR